MTHREPDNDDRQPEREGSPDGHAEAEAAGTPAEAGRTDEPGAAVVVATPDRRVRGRLADAIEALGHTCVTAAGTDGVHRALSEREIELVLLDAELADAPGLDVASSISEAGAGIVVLAERRAVDLAVEAMRAGALDLLGRDVGEAELAARLGEALSRVRSTSGRGDRVRRLRDLCQQLNSARHEMGKKVNAMCSDLAIAYDELAGQLDRVTLASEFAGLIGQELDIEDLLRVAMEYVLRKSGPTNASVFLPDTAGDFTLGAYVNYDQPADTAEMMLDHLADVLAPRFEHVRGAAVMRDSVDREDRLGSEAHWLEGSTALVVPCVHEDECLAVLALFRDERSPFDDETVATMEVIAGTFARQLGKVIHVHHRHLPKDQWGGFDGPDADDRGLAA